MDRARSDVLAEQQRLLQASSSGGGAVSRTTSGQKHAFIRLRKPVYDDDQDDPNAAEKAELRQNLPHDQLGLQTEQVIAARLSVKYLASMDRRLMRIEIMSGSVLLLVVLAILIASAMIWKADDFLTAMQKTGIAPLIGELVQTYHAVWKHQLNVTIASGTDMLVTLHGVITAIDVPAFITMFNNFTAFLDNVVNGGGGINVRLLA